ncbi:rhomboid domain-containing protein 2 [Eublepharis macularius]|uniref:Rhomboid domain-containing protein 2 n=1 Tax=Eublepharis macularius TaxID=481883 RepID=A0AA97KHT4_EUBMA|nr:rhomboid domain-containing protein 2 [Eublepharis macularius]
MERIPVATCLTVLLSLLVSGPGLLRRGEEVAPEDSALSLRPEALWEWQVHRLVTYIFVYEDVISLVCGVVIIWYFASGFEKNMGTVKHCFCTVAFAISSALLYILLRAIVSRFLETEDAKGFMPVAFAMLGVSITRSRMKRTMLFGFYFSMLLIPWLLLCVSCLIPHSSPLGNISGLVIGEIYGYGYCFGLDLPESAVSRLDQKFPFRLLKRIKGLKYVPGSLAERRASQSRKLNPVPGSYPTQSYHSSPPSAVPIIQMHPNAHALGSRPQYPLGHPNAPVPNPATGAFGELYIQHHFHTPAGSSFSSPFSQHLGVPEVPKMTDHTVSGIHQTATFPTTGAVSGTADFCRVHVG